MSSSRVILITHRQAAIEKGKEGEECKHTSCIYIRTFPSNPIFISTRIRWCAGFLFLFLFFVVQNETCLKNSIEFHVTILT